MSAVTVDHNFSTFRIKVSANTVLNDVLKDSLKHFKLLNEESPSETSSWVLTSKEKPLALDLPWRLMNLSAGAKLELKQVMKTGADDSARKPHFVRIKLQVTGHDTVIEKVDINSSIKQVLGSLAEKHSWSLDPEETKLQVFSKIIPYPELQSNTLSTLGVKESALLKLYVPANKIPVEAVGHNHDAIQDESPAIEVGIPRKEKTHELHKISAFVPPTVPLHAQIGNDEEDDYELTVAHARIYQQLLSKQTGTLGGPMTSKRMREKQASLLNQSEVIECHVRIRFPDLSHIEAIFAPGDNVQKIYQVVASSLVHDDFLFTLSISHPYESLLPSDKKLREDLKFGLRTLLLFESQKEGPFLKKEILAEARGLNEAEDVKLDHIGIGSEPSDKLENVSKPASGPKQQSSRGLSGEKKVPKWLKLSKK